MRDEQVSQSHLALQVDHQIEHLGLDGNVERRHRLVGDNQLRLQGQRSCNADALALTAGELVRVAVHLRFAQADTIKQRGNLVLDVTAFGGAVHAHRFGDDIAGGHARIERGKRVLKNDLHLPAVGTQAGFSQTRDVVSIDLDGAVGRLDQPQNGAADGRFATTGFADQAERLTLRD